MSETQRFVAFLQAMRAGDKFSHCGVPSIPQNILMPSLKESKISVNVTVLVDRICTGFNARPNCTSSKLFSSSVRYPCGGGS
eukprot:2348942-Amphidinium_carterae.1